MPTKKITKQIVKGPTLPAPAPAPMAEVVETPAPPAPIKTRWSAELMELRKAYVLLAGLVASEQFGADASILTRTRDAVAMAVAILEK